MLKKTTKYLLNYFDLDIIRIPSQGKKIITSKIGNFNLKHHADHALPRILKNWPEYSSNLPRIAVAIKQKYHDLILIDIGANIGDTVALTRTVDEFPIVCIEGDEEYFKLLSENLKQFSNTYAFQNFLGDSDQNIMGTIISNDGTLKIVSKNEHIDPIKIITLDSFLYSHPEFIKSKLLKIDTDGFDVKILKGAKNYISNTKPIIFFEYDSRLLNEQGDSALQSLYELETIGYDNIIYYDNYGQFILMTQLSNHNIINQLDQYIGNEKSGVLYYDVCLFHNEDEDIAKEFFIKETHRN
jgi:FkbM family methyltransferase